MVYKRGRPPADDSAQRQVKHARLSGGSAAPSSSQNSVRVSSQASQGHYSTPPSSRTASSQQPGSSQFVYGDDDDDVVDLTQDDDNVSLELYGTLDIKVVGVRCMQFPCLSPLLCLGRAICP
jgi:hypothetical protein